MMADEQNLAIFAPLKRSRSELEAYEASDTLQGDRMSDDNDNNGAKRSRNGSEGDQTAMNGGSDCHYINGTLDDHQGDAMSPDYSLHGEISLTHAYNSLDQPCKENNRHHKGHHNHNHHHDHPPPDQGHLEESTEQMNLDEEKSSPPNQGEVDAMRDQENDKDDDDDDDGEDDDDSLSDISELSGISIERWRPTAGPIAWVQQQIEANMDPREVLQQLLPDTIIPPGVDDLMLWKVVINILSEPPKRTKLPSVNTIQDVLGLLSKAKKIMVLTGAGVSVSCGIPDFRSKDGIYSRLAVEYPDLPDPQAMFDIHYFRRNPRPFFKFAKEIYPGQFEASLSHKFIRLLEEKGKLLRNYTQNIDTLEQVAGVQRVIQCHGSFMTATCMHCKYRVDAEGVRADIMNQIIPRCPKCPTDEPEGIMKPDIVFFGESLPDQFHKQMEIDKDECDLLIVMGSSLKVRPVALIPNSLPAEVPQILINREPLKHLNFDVELLGDCDHIVNELCRQLDDSWQKVCQWPGPLKELTKDQMVTPPASLRPSPMRRMDDSSQMSFQMTGESEDSRMSGILEGEEQPQASSVTMPHFTSSSDSRGSDSMEPAPSAPPSSPTSHHESDSQTVTAEGSQATCAGLTEHRNPSSSDLEELRACWQPRIFNLAKRLQDGTYLFLPPSRYIFRGAEVYDEDDESDEGSDDEDPIDCNIQKADPAASKEADRSKDQESLVPPDLDNMLPFCDIPSAVDLPDLPDSAAMQADLFTEH